MHSESNGQVNPRLFVRPWGAYIDLLRTPTLVIKLLTVNEASRTSLQFHEERSEHWHVVDGEGRALIGESVVALSPGVSVNVATRTVHRIENAGVVPLNIVEVQRGRCSEEDIVRLADDFGRATADEAMA
jgi:mannose-1-phosphate guanylyltransferase/mannose-6-phosphate isomerase